MNAPYGSLMKDQGPCECGTESCDLWGTLKKPNRTGKRCVRGCKCLSCRNRNNRKRGLTKQRKAAVALGLDVGKFLPSDEEAMGGNLRMECKATKREAGPVWTAFRLVEAQSEAARPIGDHRPFVAAFMPPGEDKDGLVVCRMSALPQVAAAIVESWGAA